MANWKLIKEQYCAGIPPRDLAKKHKVKAQTISNRATEDKWTVEKSKKQEEIANNFKAQVDELTSLSLPVLKQIIQQKSSSGENIMVNCDLLIKAIKTVMDISGLKKETVDNNINTTPFRIQIVE
jgi:hypothetical protein